MRGGQKRFLKYLGIVASINIPATAYFLSIMRWSKNKGGGIYSEGFSGPRSFLPKSLRTGRSQVKESIANG
ncbi:hypothetical protein GAYE_FCTG49G0063 [Galdieria yellowstonensis]|uniref:Uncharacterized protein n=1 Tax=Galdieria yellowstonensis TaxID=3028027 RepID=A0AAV9I5S1_9RHOD|nr:hypothetical protein GAYE_FCTG49G0063 [Galdieria yellowstonensis]